MFVWVNVTQSTFCPNYISKFCDEIAIVLHKLLRGGALFVIFLRKRLLERETISKFVAVYFGLHFQRKLKAATHALTSLARGVRSPDFQTPTPLLILKL